MDVVANLVIAGSHVQKLDSYGRTPAHLAATYGYSQVLDKLLMAGYAVDTPGGTPKGLTGPTVLHIAAKYGHGEVSRHSVWA